MRFETGAQWRSRAGCEAEEKHKDKKGKEEKKKQVAQLDDGMCAMACEQMRQVMETLRTLADNSTGEDKEDV